MKNRVLSSKTPIRIKNYKFPKAGHSWPAITDNWLNIYKPPIFKTMQTLTVEIYGAAQLGQVHMGSLDSQSLPMGPSGVDRVNEL